MIALGAHIRGDDPIGEATARGAGRVQFFLGDPQSWKKAQPAMTQRLSGLHPFRSMSTRRIS